jgi:hypothetical protein
MSHSDRPPHQLLDRMIRQSLRHPDNLRALLGQAVPDLAGNFDCTRANLLEREFPLDDWRHRETDVPFEIPFQLGTAEVWALVVLLVEHQSQEDPVMPLRLLYFAVTYWDRQWRDWEKRARPRPPFRLNPVLPLVLYTADTPWSSNRTLQDLLAEPKSLHAFGPSWQPLFWNLADCSAQQLLDTGEEWLQTLAVIRAQAETAENFERVYREALRRLEGLVGRDHARWYDLLRMLLTWALWRRPAGERPNLLAAAQNSQENLAHRQEVQTVGQTIAEALIAEGEARGEARGEALGVLRTSRRILQRVLAQRFGALPATIAQRIEAVEDPERLEVCIERVSTLQSLDDLPL